jgi:hypothetical protein
MSRYVIPSLNPDHLVTVGFDASLPSFFLQVDSYAAPREEDVWLGTAPHALPTVAALIEVTRPYAILSPQIQAWLHIDAAPEQEGPVVVPARSVPVPSGTGTGRRPVRRVRQGRKGTR